MPKQSISTLRVLIATFAVAVLAAATTFAQDNAVLDRMKKDITYLASDECEGRGVGTAGINKAADYIVSQLKEAGLEPGGKGRTFFQPFTVSEGSGVVEGENSLILRGPLGQTV